MRPTCKSYFSGAGGLDYAFEDSGINIIQSLEYDSTACETLALNFKHKIEEKDIRNMEVLTQPKSDIVSMTYPCTKYSTIADIHGTRTGDELFLHAFRHIALEQPEAYVIENVPGMRKFPVVMEAMSKLPGYYVTTLCPIDASIWLPQRRPRLIMIATRKPFAISHPEKGNAIKLKDIIEKEVEMEIPDCVYSRMNGKYRDLPIISDPEDSNSMAPTCVAHYSKDKGTRLVRDKKFRMGVRPYTVKEYARLQGFPDSFKFSGTPSRQFKQIGNAVAVPVGRWIASNLIKYFN